MNNIMKTFNDFQSLIPPSNSTMSPNSSLIALNSNDRNLLLKTLQSQQSKTEEEIERTYINQIPYLQEYYQFFHLFAIESLLAATVLHSDMIQSKEHGSRLKTKEQKITAVTSKIAKFSSMIPIVGSVIDGLHAILEGIAHAQQKDMVNRLCLFVSVSNNISNK